MRARTRVVVRLLVLFLVAWVILDFGLTVDGAFAFDVDESLVGIHSTHGPAIPLTGVVVASATGMLRDPASVRRPVSAHVPVWSMPDHPVPRSRLLAGRDQAGASDDH